MTTYLTRTFIRAVALAALLAAPSASASAQSWSAEKAKLVAAAEQEGELILFSQPNRRARGFLSKAWKEAYPKIKLSISAFPGSRFEPRVKIERSSGKYLWDVVFTGSTIGFDLEKDGFLDPLLPELKDPDINKPEIWGGWDEAFVDLKKKYVFSTNRALKSPVYNALKLSPEKVDKAGLQILFDPELKGKIVWHEPNIPGPGAQFTFYLKHRMSEADMKRFIIGQQVKFMSHQNEITEALARGTALLALGPGNTHALMAPYVKAGVKVDVRKFKPTAELNDITIGGSTIYVVKNRPHPNATRLFLNWLLSKDTQMGFSKATEQNSRRTDVASVTEPNATPKPGVKYAVPQRQEHLAELNAAKKLVAKIRKEAK